jgi:hypothetical protein
VPHATTEPVLDLLALPTPAQAVLKPRPPRPAAGERYLGGPIPWTWLSAAARLPGQALAVGLAVWLRGGIAKSAEVRLSLSGLDSEMGVKRDAARRGLAALERAGLVHVTRGLGRKPRVTLLPGPPGGIVARSPGHPQASGREGSDGGLAKFPPGDGQMQ